MGLGFRRARFGTVAVAACTCFAILQPVPSEAWHYGHRHGYGGAEALIGGAIGGIIGGAISRGAQPAPAPAPQVQERVIIKEREVRRPAAPRVDPYEREQTRNVQIALNYFGFDAGSPDGVSGQRTRGAIRGYQSYMGFPVSGHLSDYERSFLISSHARALSGGEQTTQAVAMQGTGSRGLLKLYQQNQTAGAVINTGAGAQPQTIQPAPQTAPAAVQTTPAAVQTAAVQTAAVQTAAVAAEQEPEAEPEAEPAPASMPSFIGGPVEASMASFCNKTNLVTSTNGGMVTAASMVDTGVALGEQFCLARAYVMDAGERLSATVQGVSLAEMQSQCAAFAPTMRDYVAGLVTQSPDGTTDDLQAFVIKSGMNPAQLSANARICLSIGYRTDGAEVALASALVLVGLGEAAYGEVLGHHLAHGFGVPKRLDRAADWYDDAVRAMEGGAERVVAPGLKDRPALLHAAALRLRGGTPTQDPVQAAAPQPAALPSFGLPGAAAESVADN